MSSIFQASSDASRADSSVDSSVAESIQSLYRNASGTTSSGNHVDRTGSQPEMGPLSPEAGPITRLGATSSHLPNLETRQHSVLFYLSLIEGRCRTQAARILNEGRHPVDQLPENDPEVRALARQLFAEMSSELHKAGILPDEFAGRDLEDLRARYLNTFDAILQNIATKETTHLYQQSTYSSIDRSNVFAVSTRSPTALEKRHQYDNLAMAPKSFLYSHILRDGGGERMPTSIFQTQYEIKSVIGRGGYGAVYRAKNLIDEQEYAVKKIVISGKKVKLAVSSDQQHALLIEARTLSKLNHQNIVRYYGVWVETRPEEQSRDDETASGQPSESAASESSNGSQDTSAQLEPYEEPMLSDMEGSDIFERALPSTKSAGYPESSAQSSQSTGAQNALIKRSPFFRGPDSASESEKDKVVPRYMLPNQTAKPNLDAVLFIKMDIYPMTLEDFLWPEQIREGGPIEVQHCFHTLTTVRILYAILDGIDYIHDLGIIHRDLKPGNILLSVQQDPKSPSAGSINISSCPECPSGLHGKPTFITPHIGDFGLVATHLAKMKEDSHVGSKFYYPPSTDGIICPKLDVYGLGVIAFELLYKFSTRSERVKVLEELTKGIFPADFESHEMAAGIKFMTKHDREERWDCAAVRKWLQDIKKRHESAY